MEITISFQNLITIGSILTAVGVIWKYLRKANDFIQRQDKQDVELAAIRAEQTLLCFGIKACLQGLAEQGCNGPVHEALDKLEKHLNKAAHGQEDGHNLINR